LALAYTVTAVIGAPIGARLITLVNPMALRQLFGLLLISLAAGLLTRKTPFEQLGNLVLLVGLLFLVVGTLVIAVRQHRRQAAESSAVVIPGKPGSQVPETEVVRGGAGSQAPEGGATR
ncbi:MAG: hypothetical protein M3442_02350, partial [Chloroflexota bacterium]|nr:hypothetical protein [Chloroflexota bacterium]